MNKEKFTVFRYDEQTECYHRLGTFWGIWFNRRARVRLLGGEERLNTCILRIFDDLPLAVCEGDYVMPGNVAKLEKPRALYVKAVTDNRRGSPLVRHIRLDCV